MSRVALERWDWACYVAEGRLTGAQRAVLQVIARHATSEVKARSSRRRGSPNPRGSTLATFAASWCCSTRCG